MDAATEKLIADLPDREAARRFLNELADKHPAAYEKLKKNAGLLSDVATLAAFSPLLSTTLLQNPDYLWWLNRKRKESGGRSQDELLESLARFSLTNSQVEPQILFARFRRRELLRIYLRDIRRLATIAEITEEISNLADAILESALELARREIDNRFGTPQERDEKGRYTPARFCIAALGKLGSRELNYSSDIDLLFLYTAEGNTFGVSPLGGPVALQKPAKAGTPNAITNREYFVKLAQYIVKLVGEPSGEGGAYRVDLRLRPHGTLGSLALSVEDTIRYCKTDARAWERQVLIRSRGCAGDIGLFKYFSAQVEEFVFSSESVKTALENVRRSKEKIDLENVNRRGFNVKLGPGGIREIEFLAQALQLAHGGRDRWLHSPHTLISMARLADRGHITKSELTILSNAYDFLRRTEHVLQMENGLQTHTVPDDPEKRATLARRMAFAVGGDFENGLRFHTGNVRRIFARVFGSEAELSGGSEGIAADISEGVVVPDAYYRIRNVSPHFAAMLDANPRISVTDALAIPTPDACNYKTELIDVLRLGNDSYRVLSKQLAALRVKWQSFLLGIALADIRCQITTGEAKRLQTLLAEASIAAALEIARQELAKRYSTAIESLPLAVLALGKLGGRGLDYGSDLDLIMVYDDSYPVPVPNSEFQIPDSDAANLESGIRNLASAPAGVTHAEFYGRAVELFVTGLSSITRDGNLYRVDLRLRPYGSKGLSAISGEVFLKYMMETAAIWEMLAFVKLRAVGGPADFGRRVESETRRVIHERAAAIDAAELAAETRRIRLALEKQRMSPRRGGEIDIKYGPGGMLDVYFAMRYLQLRDNVPDDLEDRSTPFMLDRLKAAGSLTAASHSELYAGYEFLSLLDHNIRLTVGRTAHMPIGNQRAMDTIAAQIGLISAGELLEQLTMHRLAIRAAFEIVVS